MKWDFRKSEDSGEFILSGDITVRAAIELRAALSRALGGVDRLVIRIEGVTEADVSSLQILCSTHRTSRMLMKELRLAGRSPSFSRVAEESGFARHLSCPLGGSEGCIWTDGESSGGAPDRGEDA